MNEVILNSKIKEMRQYKRAIEELQQKASVIESEIKAEMEARNVDQVVTEDYKVTWKAVSSMRLDAKALKEERPEIYTRYAVPVESKRFVVT